MRPRSTLLAAGKLHGRIHRHVRYGRHLQRGEPVRQQVPLRGEGYGVGLSIGKAYQIGRRWNLEWEAGAGAVWLAYDKYLCKRCGDLVGQEYGWHFLPTRAALNVVYLF